MVFRRNCLLSPSPIYQIMRRQGDATFTNDQCSMTQEHQSVEPPINLTSVQILLLSVMLGILVAAVYRAQAVVAPQDSVGNLYATIDLNSASPRELSLLPGIGPVLAKRIF